MRKSRFTTLAALTLFILAFSVITLCSCADVIAQDGNAGGSAAVAAPPAIGEASATADADNGQEVLTRGPIHEAFAKPGASDQVADSEVKRQPPDPIEEMPPDQKPDGTNIVWISGYWAWDADRTDFIWVSGVWRDTPADCTWAPGYWAPDEDVYRWVSGYWKKSHTVEAYVPVPPKTVELGPTSDAPNDDYVWAPGCWIYRADRYVWRPGYWLESAPDRIYVQACYNWTPAGYLYVDSYWDYPLERRGVVFAPVYFRPAVYIRPAFVYTPIIVIETPILVANLFVAPRLGFYCFGDYYATSYLDVGIFPWIDIDVNIRFGYHDPIFSYYRHHGYNGDRDWEDHFRRDYRDRRDHQEFRPPRTFRAQESLLNSRPDRARDRNTVVGRTLSDVVQKPAGTTRFAKVDDERRKTIATQARDQRTERQKATPVVPRAQREKPAPTAKPDKGATTTRPTRPSANPDTARPARGGEDTAGKTDKGATTTRPARPSATSDTAKKPARGGEDATVKPDKGATTTRPTRPTATPTTLKRPPRGGEDTTPKADEPTTNRSGRSTVTPETSKRPARGNEDTTPRTEQPSTTRPERPAATPETAKRPARGETPPAIEDRAAPRAERPAANSPDTARRPARSANDAAAAKGATRKTPADDADTPAGRSGAGGRGSRDTAPER